MTELTNNDEEVVEKDETILNQEVEPTNDSDDEQVEEEVEKTVEDGDKSDEEKSDKSEEDDDKDKEQKKEDEVPDEYEFSFPDEVEVDQEAVQTFKEWAKDHKLSQKDAQDLVDLNTDLMSKQYEKNQQSYSEMVSGWADEARSDKEFGGDKFDDNVAVAKKAMEAFGTEELSEALDLTGAGNHPEIIRFFYKVGKAIVEDGMVAGTPSKEKESDPAKILFPDMK